MLFELISDGLNTRIELDGKRINGCHLVNFAHRRDKDGNDCRVTLELDLSRQQGQDFRECHVFEPAEPGEFIELVQKYEDHEREQDLTS